MDKIIVEGGQRLQGKIEISGMKNSALPIIFACLLIKEECILENIPRVSDVENALKILNNMGASAEFVDMHTVKINTKGADNSSLDFELISKMRASSYLMSTCVARYGSVFMPYPGGCNFGSRPIEQHIKGLEMLGAICVEDGAFLRINRQGAFKGTKITLDKISVGATINMIMASVLSSGTTIIENVAKEPHVLDLISFLNISGADIRVFDNSITVKGVSSLRGIKYRIYSDMIEALTFIACVGVSGGEAFLLNAEYDHIKSLIPLFDGMNISVRQSNGGVNIKSLSCPLGASVITGPYPAFPTDLHPQFSALLCYCEGGGIVTETIFPGRFAYTLELKKMGAFIERNGNAVKINRSELHGTIVDATDLRAGAALVVAALGANGRTIINNVNYIVRGYEDIVSKLSSVGAKIFYDNK